MASPHGCIIWGLQSGAERPLRKWSVRKRAGAWRIYAPDQCCPVKSAWTYTVAIREAQQMAKGIRL